MIVSVRLPWPSAVLSPNARPSHWAVLRKAQKLSRATAWALTKAAKPAPVAAEGLLKVCIMATPPVNRAHDRDNMLGRLKAPLDGIAAALRVDDARFVFWPLAFGPARRPGSVVITVEAMP